MRSKLTPAQPVDSKGRSWLYMNGMRVGTVVTDSYGKDYLVTAKGLVRQEVKV